MAYSFNFKHPLTNKAKVKIVLENSPATRNSDARLYHEFNLIEGIVREKIIEGKRYFVYTNDDLRRLKNPESIIRVRAEIQNVKKEFLPTDPDVIRKRRIRAEEVRTYYSQYSKNKNRGFE